MIKYGNDGAFSCIPSNVIQHIGGGNEFVVSFVDEKHFDLDLVPFHYEIEEGELIAQNNVFIVDAATARFAVVPRDALRGFPPDTIKHGLSPREIIAMADLFEMHADYAIRTNGGNRHMLICLLSGRAASRSPLIETIINTRDVSRRLKIVFAFMTMAFVIVALLHALLDALLNAIR